MKNIKLSVKALGTVCEIFAAVPDEDEKRVRETAASARDYLLDMDDRLSVFKPDSEISRLNNAGLNKAVKVSPDTFEILRIAKRCAADTDGIFDVTVGKSTERWRRGKSEPESSVTANYKGLLLEETASAARLSMQHSQLISEVSQRATPPTGSAKCSGQTELAWQSSTSAVRFPSSGKKETSVSEILFSR